MISAVIAAHLAFHGAAFAEDLAPIAQRILSQADAELQDAELTDAMASLDSVEQADLLRRLFRDGDGPMAAQAIVMLIQRDAVDSATRDVLDLEIQDWNPSLQLIVIGAMRDRPSIEESRQYADVVRTTWFAALDRYDVLPDARQIVVVDSSIRALSRMGDPRATADAKAVVQRMPGSSGAWIVLLDSGTVGDAERVIAQGLLNDDTRRVPLRVLAAIALGGSHPTAHAYIESVVNGIVDQFGAKTAREMMVGSMSAPYGDPARQAYADFMRTAFPVLSYMSLIRDGSLDATLRRCAAATNDYIRDMARYAIASSSPQLVLEEPAFIPDGNLLLETAAAAALLHPEMHDQLAGRFGAPALDAAIEHVRGADGYVVLGQAAPPLPMQP